MPELLQRSTTTGEGSPPSAASLESLLVADEQLARVELRRQIARLEHELSRLFASAFPRKGIEWDVAPGGGPRVLGVGELEQVRDGLATRVAEARRALDCHAEVESENRETLERMIAEPQKLKWVRISNQDIGEKGCRHWHSRPRFGLLGMLMGWWRVRLSSGCPLSRGRRPPASRTNTPIITVPVPPAPPDGGRKNRLMANGRSA
jgi:hypothetical protein